MPMKWLLLFYSILILFIMSMMMIYFMKFNIINNFFSNKSLLKYTPLQWNWKW